MNKRLNYKRSNDSRKEEKLWANEDGIPFSIEASKGLNQNQKVESERELKETESCQKEASDPLKASLKRKFPEKSAVKSSSEKDLRLLQMDPNSVVRWAHTANLRNCGNKKGHGANAFRYTVVVVEGEGDSSDCDMEHKATGKEADPSFSEVGRAVRYVWMHHSKKATDLDIGSYGWASRSAFTAMDYIRRGNYAGGIRGHRKAFTMMLEEEEQAKMQTVAKVQGLEEVSMREAVTRKSDNAGMFEVKKKGSDTGVAKFRRVLERWRRPFHKMDDDMEEVANCMHYGLGSTTHVRTDVLWNHRIVGTDRGKESGVTLERENILVEWRPEGSLQCELNPSLPWEPVSMFDTEAPERIGFGSAEDIWPCPSLRKCLWNSLNKWKSMGAAPALMPESTGTYNFVTKQEKPAMNIKLSSWRSQPSSYGGLHRAAARYCASSRTPTIQLEVLGSHPQSTQASAKLCCYDGIRVLGPAAGFLPDKSGPQYNAHVIRGGVFDWLRNDMLPWHTYSQSKLKKDGCKLWAHDEDSNLMRKRVTWIDRRDDVKFWPRWKIYQSELEHFGMREGIKPSTAPWRDSIRLTSSAEAVKHHAVNSEICANDKCINAFAVRSQIIVCTLIDIG
ncbi:uncharacterized protein BDR25DRAFT_354858 [Lindgomyces ingoldianus]|uniref:Uncharacterized protein n=1 Tax=Lindgomyces ingoldianus TaxID=673940 RepID=A0ACB6QV52_9PLEO|nr:uncharacterized protein BDR25DRAFT_354858 [Lindgomyces ingoldianus]KAF2470914.1 hypothetical protein BDR25DRAFT_354858 [Lindgomyces ingoldianus]